MNNLEILDEEIQDKRKSIEPWKICVGSTFFIIVTLIIVSRGLNRYISAAIVTLLFIVFMYGYSRAVIISLKRNATSSSAVIVTWNTILVFLNLFFLIIAWKVANTQ
jgi:hypothetical protein